MASTGIDAGVTPPAYASDKEKNEEGIPRASSFSGDSTKHDGVHRKLKSRHIQLIGIGGTIGTAIFVRIDSRL